MKAQTNFIVEEEAYFNTYGTYFSDVDTDGLGVHTYEKICRGFFLVEKTPEAFIYTGYGDLADKYTYEIPIPNSTVSSGTTSTSSIGL